MPSPCVCTTVRKANRALFRLYESALAEAELSVVQFAILRFLERNGESTLSQIAEDQVMERTSLYRTIAPLVESKAIRIRNADRGKAKRAALTRKGRRLIDSTLPYWEDVQARVVAVIGGDKWSELADVMLDIAAELPAIELPSE